MGASQSGQQLPANTSLNQHGILVVNPNPEYKSLDREIVLPKRAPPVLSVDGHNIDPLRHSKEFQLDPKLWIDFLDTINEYANSRADLVAKRHILLQERIIQVDNHVQKFTDSYVNDTHKALAQMNDDCRRIEEINKKLHKCNIQNELCIDMLKKLNLLLPQDQRLEPIDAP